MIVAAGLSPAWQQILEFDSLALGDVNRAAQITCCASGKAINVAVALAHLGVECTAVTVLGGTMREAIERELAQLGVAATIIAAAQPTRTCTTLIERSSGRVTELVQSTPAASAAEIAQFAAKLQTAAQSAEVLVFSGSLPPGAPDTIVRDTINTVSCPVVLDVRGEALLLALAAGPAVVKPNRAELAQTLGRSLDTDESLRAALLELLDRGAQSTVVTDGPRVIWAARHGRVYRFEPISIEPVNPIGSGDCFAAGMAWGMAAGDEWPQCVMLGIAAGAENALRLLPSRLDAARVRELARDVKFIEV